MAQTVYHETVSTEERVVVDVYMHPNNARAPLDDPQTEYCYTVFAIKFHKDELEEFKEPPADFCECCDYDWEFEESKANRYDMGDELEDKSIIKLFEKAGTDFIWECGSKNEHTNYSEYHAFKEEAIKSLYEQTC
jgi:hypothetical protein